MIKPLEVKPLVLIVLVLAAVAVGGVFKSTAAVGLLVAKQALQHGD